MKKYAFLSLALTATCLSGFAQGIEVAQLTRLSESELKEIVEGKRPEIAIEFAAHTRLPVSFYLKGDLVNLVESGDQSTTIEIEQTFYARVVEEGLVLSSNLTDWKPFMEFITGKATVVLSIQDGEPSIVIGSETNRRS